MTNKAFKEWEAKFEQNKKFRGAIIEEIIKLFQEKELTFSEAKKILLNTIDALEAESKRRKI